MDSKSLSHTKWGLCIPLGTGPEIIALTARTIFTMEQDYMKDDFVEAGIEVVVRNKEDRELIAKRIYEELELGIIKETTFFRGNKYA